MTTFTLWRYRDLKERGFCNSRAQLKRMVDFHGFPTGRLLSPNVRTWTAEEVLTYYDTRPSERKSTPSNLPKPWNWEGTKADGTPRKRGGRPRKHKPAEAAAEA